MTMEGIIFAAIRQKSDELGCPIVALNGVEDHIHVAVKIAPSVAVANWVSQVKGASAHTVNRAQSTDSDRFHWQEGYGVLTFGVRNLDTVVGYIARQKEQHQTGNTITSLERSEP